MTSGRATPPQQLSGHRATARGITSELDEYWSAAHRNLDRARRRLPSSNWLTAHRRVEPKPSTLESPPEEPPDD